jgi:hypothetical protein
LSGLDLRDDAGLKIRDQLACIGITPVGAITQMFEQVLQQKQIADGQRLVLAGGRHVPSGARESGKDFVRASFAVPIEVGTERRGRPLVIARAIRRAYSSVGEDFGWARLISLSPRITQS